MKSSEFIQEVQFQIEGEFLGFIAKSGGELKYIQVAVDNRILPLKVIKELRPILGRQLVVGDRIQVLVNQTVKGNFSKIKLTAEQVQILSSSAETIAFESLARSSSCTKKGKILLCGKPSCLKRGGRQLDNILAEAINNLGLKDKVTIQQTGCQKQCKNAPSITLMPGKVKHYPANSEEIITMLKKHYLSNCDSNCN
jgi:hypothetical protein